MKFIRVSFIILLVSFACIALFSQDNGVADGGTADVQNEKDSVSGTGTEGSGNITTEVKKKEPVVQPEKVVKDETKVPEKVRDKKRTSEKNNAVKATAETEEEVREPEQKVSTLLIIKEGDFKYRRIPDIKFKETKSELPDTVAKVADVKDDSNKSSSGGLFGLSKSVSDVVVKVGILILILLIFVIYKSRLSGPGSRSSKKRNVLNSYRK